MGELIPLHERRVVSPRATGRPAFFFDLGCPLSYLAAEHIERSFGQVDWVPVPGVELRGELSRHERNELCARAEEQAAQLRLPLVWPERFPTDARRALRAATCAAQLDSAPRFALAASRLAFCGGFDLDDPGTLAEAAAAAAIPLGACLDAAGDPGRDLALVTAARGLRSRGVRELPALRAGDRWFVGSGWRVASTVLDPVRPPAASSGHAQVLTHPGGKPLAPAG